MKGYTFWHGVIVYACLKSLEQDLVGKDRWLEWASAHWIDGATTIPIAIIALVLVWLHGTTPKP